ncbi:MAG: hypothetical protein DMF44_07260 [Verrucomicrobia bacterium]|nr:MAG: hypothetical protein DMF44_07260 [Verrucomicrobiota bacterium]
MAVANLPKASRKNANRKTHRPIKKRELKMTDCAGGLVLIDRISVERMIIALFEKSSQRISPI